MKNYKISKIVLIIIITVIILSIIIFIVNYILSSKQSKKNINFYLLNSYEVDLAGMCKKLAIVEDSPFTCFIQITNFENLTEYFADEYNLKFPEINFDYPDKYMAITFGRELKEMEYKLPAVRHELYSADITFSEEYHKNTIYIYVMDKIFLIDSFNEAGSGSSFYIMNDDKKDFLGHDITDYNERVPVGHGGM